MTVEKFRPLSRLFRFLVPMNSGMARTSFSPDFTTKIDKKAFESIRTVSLEFMMDD